MTPTPKIPPQGNWLIVLAVIALSALPLWLVKGDFSGADGQAMDAVSETQPRYKPWFQPVMELPSGEVESLLFATQAAVGAGVVGYVIGVYRGRAARRRNEPFGRNEPSN